VFPLPISPPTSVAPQDVVELPAAVEQRLFRAIEPEHREEALGGNGPDPIGLATRWRFRAEEQIDRSVGVAVEARQERPARCWSVSIMLRVRLSRSSATAPLDVLRP
jgi:hypothetical protein